MVKETISSFLPTHNEAINQHLRQLETVLIATNHTAHDHLHLNVGGKAKISGKLHISRENPHKTNLNQSINKLLQSQGRAYISQLAKNIGGQAAGAGNNSLISIVKGSRSSQGQIWSGVAAAVSRALSRNL